ncbi:optineurin-like [Ctenocephalides felis]|uniref:optineurin-like n=1 Tax=Ctenocephalides felis TaxID=7515 RepID=UPI000E6E2739|nr:optineurin-like [Ctenocephalides felis]
MNMSKELLKKEEKCIEMQAQLEESTKKTHAEKCEEEQRLLDLSNDKDAFKEQNGKNSEPINEVPTNDAEKEKETFKKEYENELKILKNNLSYLEATQAPDHEHKQDSEDKLAENLARPKKDIECSDHKTKYEGIVVNYNKLDTEYQRLKDQLKICIASDKLCKDQMQRVKELNDQQNYEDQEAINRQVVDELEKRLYEQGEVIQTLVRAIEHQQSIMGTLREQKDIIATLNL